MNWILVTIFILSLIGHYKHIPLIGLNGIDALVWQEKLFFQPFSLESKFVCHLGQTCILIVISILFVITHYKHIYLVGIMVLMLLFGKKSFSFHHFHLNQSSSIECHKYGFIGHYKYIFLTGIQDIDALVW